MSRLVKTRAKSLDRTATEGLRSEVVGSEKGDRAFFQKARGYRNKLRGIHYPDEGGKRNRRASRESRIVVNLVHSHIRTLLPAVFFREPTVVARPSSPLHSGKEDTWELVLNNTLKHNGYKAETKATILDALVYHEGWKKVTQIIPEDDDQSDEGGGQGSTATTEVPRGPMPWGSKKVPVSIRVSPLQVIVDYLAPGRDPNHARFVAIKYQRPLVEMRADTRYTIPAKIDMDKVRKSIAGGSATQRMNEPEMLGSEGTTRFEATVGLDMVTFYEVWVHQDVERKLWKQCVWIMEGVETPIRMENWEDLIGKDFPGYPIHRIAFNPIPDDYPLAEVEAWEQLQEAVNWVVSKITDFVNQNNMRWAIDNNAVVDPKKTRKALMSGRAVETFEVKGGAKASDAVSPLQGQSLGQETYRLVDILVTFIERTAGLGQNLQQQGGIFRTATEADIVKQASSIRDSERIDVVAEFLKADVQKLQTLIMNTADQDFVFRLAGDTGRVKWGRFSKEDMQWGADVEIKVDSFRELDMREEMIKWQQVLALGLQLFPILGPVIRLDVMFENLVKAARVSDPESIIGNLVGAREYQMIEIMQMMLNGEPVPPQAQEPHGEHITAIEFFENSPLAQQLDPQVMNVILEHKQAHELMLQQLQQQTSGNGQPSTLGQNPLDDISAFSEANRARSDSATEREATRSGGREQQEFL